VETQFEVNEHHQLVLTREGKSTIVPLKDIVIERPMVPGANGYVFSGYRGSQQVVVKIWAKRRQGDDRDKLNQGVKELLKASQYPNSARLFDAEVFDGHLLVVMEFIDGKTLCDWLVSEAPTLGVRSAVARKLLLNDREARRMGLFHGDLHHKNVMVVTGDAQNKVGLRIIDPGASKLMLKTDPHKRHLRKLHETISRLLWPFEIDRLWIGLAPAQWKTINEKHPPELDILGLAELVHDWHWSFLEELPHFLEVRDVHRPLPMKRLFGDYGARYPNGSLVRAELTRLESAHTKEALEDIAGPLGDWKEYLA